MSAPLSGAESNPSRAAIIWPLLSARYEIQFVFRLTEEPPASNTICVLQGADSAPLFLMGIWRFTAAETPLMLSSHETVQMASPRGTVSAVRRHDAGLGSNSGHGMEVGMIKKN